MAYTDSLYKVSINTPAGTVECVGGSYNGVPFFVEESSTSGGRNVVTTALPFSDAHVNEDVGQKVREFPIRFYLVGTDCETQRERLEEAFNTEGAFELVHPHYGKFFARCTSYSISFSNSELEYISGEVTFVPEADVKKAARTATDDAGKVVMKADAAIKDAGDDFEQGFSIVGKAESVVKAANNAVKTALDAVESARNMMRRYDEFVSNISQIRDNIGTLLKTPGEFVTRFQNCITMTAETFDDDGGFMDYTNESLTLMDSVEYEESELKADEMKNFVSDLVLMTTAGMALKCALSAEYSSAEEVRTMQDKINTVFENAMAKVQSFKNYQTLADMLATILKYLSDVVANLPAVVELPLLNTRNVLAVCFDCFGSLDNLDAMMERNEIADPMIITRKSLKVLSK